MANTINSGRKKPWKSKTIWANTILVLMAGLNQLGELGVSPERMILAIGLLNILLRLVTKEQLEILPKS